MFWNIRKIIIKPEVKEDLIGWFLLLFLLSNYCKYRRKSALVAVLDQQTCQLMGGKVLSISLGIHTLLINDLNMWNDMPSNCRAILVLKTESCSLPWIGFPRVTAMVPGLSGFLTCVSLTAYIFKGADLRWDTWCDSGRVFFSSLFFFIKQTGSYMNQSTEAQPLK